MKLTQRRAVKIISTHYNIQIKPQETNLLSLHGRYSLMAIVLRYTLGLTMDPCTTSTGVHGSTDRRRIRLNYWTRLRLICHASPRNFVSRCGSGLPKRYPVSVDV